MEKNFSASRKFSLIWGGYSSGGFYFTIRCNYWTLSTREYTRVPNLALLLQLFFLFLPAFVLNVRIEVLGCLLEGQSDAQPSLAEP